MFIVLVEDDPYIAQSICAALNYLNISVEHVSHARAADYFIRHSAVDLCLLDLGLPDSCPHPSPPRLCLEYPAI